MFWLFFGWSQKEESNCSDELQETQMVWTNLYGQLQARGLDKFTSLENGKPGLKLLKTPNNDIRWGAKVAGKGGIVRDVIFLEQIVNFFDEVGDFREGSQDVQY